MTVDLAWQWEEAVAARDLDALCDLLTEDVVVVTPKGKVLEGREAVRDYYAGPGFDHLEVSHEGHDFALHDSGVRMTARQIYRWKESGEHAYERPLEVAFEIRDGRIARVEMRILAGVAA